MVRVKVCIRKLEDLSQHRGHMKSHALVKFEPTDRSSERLQSFHSHMCL